MTISPAVLDAMLAAGCSAEQIVAAVKADLLEAEVRKDAKRAGNAERQQRFRDSRKARKSGARNDDNARNALRDVTPPIDNTHTPSPDISPDGESQTARGDDCTAVVEKWNETAQANDLRTCQKLTTARRKACQARLRDDGLPAILQAIERIPRSSFLRGQTGSWSGANIDFLLRPDTVTKILEGKYDDRPVPTPRSPDAWRGSPGNRPADNRDGFRLELEERAFGGPAHG